MIYIISIWIILAIISKLCFTTNEKFEHYIEILFKWWPLLLAWALVLTTKVSFAIYT